MNNALKIYNETNEKIKALSLAGFLIGWDMQTEMPKKADHSKQLATLSEMEYNLATTPEYKNAIDLLFANKDSLDEVLKHEITVMKESNDKLSKIPVEEYVAFSSLTNEFYNVYVECKQNNDFKKAMPYYQKVIDYRHKYAKWLETPTLKGYDVLLDEFERGMTVKEYDEFFNLLKTKLVPVILKINALPKKEFKWAEQIFPAEGQKQFQEYLREVFGFTPDLTVIKESEHPFTSSNTVTDVRITNHFYKNNFASSIFSAIHEMGHGIYELQVAPEIDETMSGGGASMAMHESQSRFMENLVARSPAFWKRHFAKLKEIFPSQLEGVTAQDMIEYVNLAECSLIRTEADELTYSLHVLIRYEMEKRIMAGEITAEEIPQNWNALYKEYLGVDVPDDTHGCLQDVHWAYGEFGYFPTYALGSAYSSQIYNAMNKCFNVEEAIEGGNMKAITDWLKDNIHKYGSSKFSKDILYLATGEEFNPEYYVDYLVKKYTALYKLN